MTPDLWDGQYMRESFLITSSALRWTQIRQTTHSSALITSPKAVSQGHNCPCGVKLHLAGAAIISVIPHCGPLGPLKVNIY